MIAAWPTSSPPLVTVLYRLPVSCAAAASSPPPEAWSRTGTLDGALPETATRSVIWLLAPAASGPPVSVQVAAAAWQDQPGPDMASAVRPAGRVAVKVTWPLVGP